MSAADNCAMESELEEEEEDGETQFKAHKTDTRVDTDVNLYNENSYLSNSLHLGFIISSFIGRRHRHSTRLICLRLEEDDL